MQIEKTDFVVIPSQDLERTRKFYGETLGLRPDEHAQGDRWIEFWAGDLCIGIWEPEKMGRPFEPTKNGPIAFRVADVHEARAELEEKGVKFLGDVIDSGVCHIAPFEDPDGNHLMLHRRYAPHAH